MFKHILVPTDGSELSKATAQRAISFAKEAGARVTVFFAKPEYPIAYFGEGALIGSATLGTQEQGLGGTFRRSNAGKRDRSVELSLSAHHSDFAAYEALIDYHNEVALAARELVEVNHRQAVQIKEHKFELVCATWKGGLIGAGVGVAVTAFAAIVFGGN